MVAVAIQSRDELNSDSPKKSPMRIGNNRVPLVFPEVTCQVKPPTPISSWSEIHTRPGPFLVGVAGGTASGKTSVARLVETWLQDAPGWGVGTVASFSQDSFYKELQSHVSAEGYNWDHPDAFDWEETANAVRSLRNGAAVSIPEYDYANNRRFPESKSKLISGAEPLRVVVVDGILLFHDEELLKLFDLTIFVDVDDDERLCRRLQRDVEERGRDVEGVLAQYEQTVKPSYEAFCAPTKGFADIVIPRGAGNKIGVQAIVDTVHRNAKSR